MVGELKSGKDAAWRSLVSSAALPLGAVAIHLVTLQLPFVNQESAFNSAATYFRTGDVTAIQEYFDLDANTVVVSALGSMLSSVLHTTPDYGCRLLSILCVALLAFSIQSMTTPAQRFEAMLLQALILLNPLIWTFSGRGTADFPPMAIAVASVALFWREKTNLWILVAATLLFALAVLTKYHALLLLPFVALSPNTSQTLRVRAFILAATAVTATIGLIVYNLIIFEKFGFWITPPKFAVALSPAPANTASNFVRYGGYLALLACPFSVRAAFAPSERLGTALKLGIVAIAFVLGYALPPSVGEMNFGPFDRWVGEGFSGAVLSALFAVMLLSIVPAKREFADLGTVAALLAFLLLLSGSRPAQRYLILALPFYYLLLARMIDLRKFAIPTVAACIAINAFVAISQIETGQLPTPPTVFGPSRRW
jgi:hypothetical protein